MDGKFIVIYQQVWIVLQYFMDSFLAFLECSLIMASLLGLTKNKSFLD